MLTPSRSRYDIVNSSLQVFLHNDRETRYVGIANHRIDRSRAAVDRVFHEFVRNAGFRLALVPGDERRWCGDLVLRILPDWIRAIRRARGYLVRGRNRRDVARPPVVTKAGA